MRGGEGAGRGGSAASLAGARASVRTRGRFQILTRHRRLGYRACALGRAAVRRGGRRVGRRRDWEGREGRRRRRRCAARPPFRAPAASAGPTSRRGAQAEAWRHARWDRGPRQPPGRAARAHRRAAAAAAAAAAAVWKFPRRGAGSGCAAVGSRSVGGRAGPGRAAAAVPEKGQTCPGLCRRPPAVRVRPVALRSLVPAPAHVLARVLPGERALLGGSRCRHFCSLLKTVSCAGNAAQSLQLAHGRDSPGGPGSAAAARAPGCRVPGAGLGWAGLGWAPGARAGRGGAGRCRGRTLRECAADAGVSLCKSLCPASPARDGRRAPPGARPRGCSDAETARAGSAPAQCAPGPGYRALGASRRRNNGENPCTAHYGFLANETRTPNKAD
ncbi:uncharacterized protein [Vulpes vulpes]|uniref:Uncharacterized protein n=1 Tax=Vulpes vulpes TaxID=9627 RepID=A0ABM4ZXU7_VULVU